MFLFRIRPFSVKNVDVFGESINFSTMYARFLGVCGRTFFTLLAALFAVHLDVYGDLSMLSEVLGEVSDMRNFILNL